VLLGLFAFLESRAEHPLMPLHIFKNRTRAASFAAMMLGPAAMFAMFYFLSLFVQQIVGYSPLRAGFAFLPFSAGIVIGAGLASNLVSRVNPRFVAGTGTLLASFALFMFSRLSIDDSPSAVVAALAGPGTAGSSVSYVTDLLPWIVVMSIGMGLTFVPLTLTAVHHIQAHDSGIGSGVLNTMQQVGGALGLSLLATVATQTMDDLSAKLAKAAEQAGVAAGPIPDAVMHQVFTAGASDAFLFGSGLMLIASLVTWAFLNVKHEELATDGPEAPVHVG
jgi:predicted MFS family arabinose efflux permease